MVQMWHRVELIKIILQVLSFESDKNFLDFIVISPDLLDFDFCSETKVKKIWIFILRKNNIISISFSNSIDLR